VKGKPNFRIKKKIRNKCSPNSDTFGCRREEVEQSLDTLFFKIILKELAYVICMATSMNRLRQFFLQTSEFSSRLFESTHRKFWIHRNVFDFSRKILKEMFK
jgi:hypothetical protein